MVDGQLHMDLRDLYIPHDSTAAEVQLGIIVLRCRQDGFLRVGFHRRAGDYGFVVGDCQLPDTVKLSGIRLGHHFLILRFDQGLVFLVIQVADNGIQGQKQCKQENDTGDDDADVPSFHVLFLRLGYPGGCPPGI